MSRGVRFPFIHDLGALADLLPRELSGDESLRGVEELTPFAATTRYPFVFRDTAVDEDEYRQLLGLAERVMAWAERAITEPDTGSSEGE